MLDIYATQTLKERIIQLQEDIESLYETLDMLPVDTLLSRLSVKGAIKLKQTKLDKIKKEYDQRIDKEDK